MNREQLIARLYVIACSTLASANSGNPFISKSDAMKDINMIRRIAAET